jgi:hypothetical protein
MDADAVEGFTRTVDEAAARLLACSEAEASRVPAPGKWSKKEIIGHLIDSAVNNHVRFVRAQASHDLVFDGYDQDEWVRVQRYRDRGWTDLVRLWQGYNHHLAAVMAAADAAVLMRPRSRHNLDEIAFKPVPRETPATLDYMMRDYIVHLEHHLRQALPNLNV